MFLSIFLLFVYLAQSTTTTTYDGIIRRSTDGTSYAYLSPPRSGNHAAFIEEIASSHTLSVAWFSGGEGTPNCSIALSLLQFGSQQFTPGVIVSERVNYSNQNPVLYWNNQTQMLHLYHSSQLGNAGETNSEIWHLQSKDQGITWSTPESFYTLPGAFDRNRIIPTLNNDGLILPCYNSSPGVDYSFILRSSSNTTEWIRTDIEKSDYLIQPTIVRLNNSSHLRAFFRDENNVAIYYSDSNDDGLTWSKPIPTSLPNDNSGIQAYTLRNGGIIMAFNNLTAGKPRSPLTVALSYDGGMSWPYQRNIQVHDDDNSTIIGDYSYPSLLQTSWSGSDDNDIHLVYTYKSKIVIKYVRFNEKWVRQGQ
ncbi:unnamed protein product [Adineta steineri]|uniref:Sialidase domain-containing protein n=2 Tax=Adineta steineri TaxID=433720 RepID=A0A819IW55_9BILA|nr:unnamed protein product [Adineta steineri]